jgi:hypothetical protein
MIDSHAVSAITGDLRDTASPDLDRPHPSTHPLWDAAVALTALDRPGQIPELWEVSAAIERCEAMAIPSDQHLHGNANITSALWGMMQYRALAQAAHTSEVVDAAAWAAIAAQANREIDRCSKRVPAAPEGLVITPKLIADYRAGLERRRRHEAMLRREV